MVRDKSLWSGAGSVFIHPTAKARLEVGAPFSTDAAVPGCSWAVDYTTMLSRRQRLNGKLVWCLSAEALAWPLSY